MVEITIFCHFFCVKSNIINYKFSFLLTNFLHESNLKSSPIAIYYSVVTGVIVAPFQVNLIIRKMLESSFSIIFFDKINIIFNTE